MAALAELEEAYDACRDDPAFERRLHNRHGSRLCPEPACGV